MLSELSPPRPARELVDRVIARGYRLRRRRRVLTTSAIASSVAAIVVGAIALAPRDAHPDHVIIDRPSATTTVVPHIDDTEQGGLSGPTRADEPTPPQPQSGAVGESGVAPPSPAPRRAPLIVFKQLGDDGSERIAVIPPGTTSPQLLTDGRYEDFDPALSPDGSTIAFASNRGNLLNGVHTIYDIYLMNIDGSGIRRVTQASPIGNGNGNTDPSWSPDGRFIAYAGDDANDVSAIRVARLDGSNERIVASNAFHPSWSPDATRVVFSRSVPSGIELWMVGADGSNPVRLPLGAMQTAGSVARWSPDSASLVYAMRVMDQVEIHRFDIASSIDAPLAFDSAAYHPSWCGGADQILYVNDPDGYSNDPNPPHGPAPESLVLAGLDGSNPTTVFTFSPGTHPLVPTCGP